MRLKGSPPCSFPGLMELALGIFDGICHHLHRHLKRNRQGATNPRRRRFATLMRL